jgi:hypothetical protein
MATAQHVGLRPVRVRPLRRGTRHPEEDYPAEFALGIAELTGGPVPRFEKVEREKPADGL